MGLLDAVGDIAGATLNNFAAPFKTIFGTIPDYVGPDFSDGFLIEEIPPEGVGIQITLLGEWLPHQPFIYGGKQQLIKEYYPGNPEPTVHILGGREDNVIIKGTFKVKRLNSADTDRLREVPQALCDAIDDMRQRGNLVHLSLGEWERWGFIEHTKFEMKTLARIDYEIDFFILGDSPPSECKLQDSAFTIPADTNVGLIAAAMALEQIVAETPPGGISLGLFDTLNGLVGIVATALSVVTKFVDGVLSIATDTEKLANHAIGLIKYAQAQISQYKKQVGALNAYFGSDPTTGLLKTWNEPTNAKQAALVAKCQLATSKPIVPTADQIAASPNSTATASKYTATISTQTAALNKSHSQSIDQMLASMLKQMQKVADALPKARYVIKQGDTLQKISMHFFGNPDHWQNIMKHNQMSSTVLVPGTVIEIPKQ